MKNRIASLLVMASMPLASVVYGQWTPVTTSLNASITRSGNVGIGQNSPATPLAKLHLAPGGLSIPGAPVQPLLRLERTGSKLTGLVNWDLDISSAGSLTFSTSSGGGASTTEMRLSDTELKVFPNALRVGDDAVRNTLGVIYNFPGTSGLDGSYLSLSGTYSLGSGLFQGSSNNGKAAIVADQTGRIRFITKESGSSFANWAVDSRLSILPNGKITIGTDNAPNQLSNGADVSAYRLFVGGGILTEEVRVATGWADYVFDEDYDLWSLGAVEQYIDTHGHLPNTPSAAEVEAEGGIELGTVAVNQQEKIEELYLHLIELSKQLKELQAENQLMRVTLEALED